MKFRDLKMNDDVILHGHHYRITSIPHHGKWHFTASAVRRHHQMPSGWELANIMEPIAILDQEAIQP